MEDKKRVIIDKVVTGIFIALMAICIVGMIGTIDETINQQLEEESKKPAKVITTEEITGEVQVDLIDSFKNVKGGFTNYNIRFTGIEYPNVSIYKEAHTSMFNSSDLGIAVNQRKITYGSKFPALFTITKTDGIISKIVIEEVYLDLD